MERLTTNKDVKDMSMTELAHNCCYAKDREARYRDYELDIDARDLARKLMVEYGAWNEDDELDRECLTDNSVFDEMILGHLLYDADEISGLISLFYRNLWAMANVTERLKQYEDLGLTPDQLKEVDKLYTEKCKQISDMSRYIVEKLDDAKPAYNRILDSLEENKMQVGQISGLNKAINIVRECMENMDKIEFHDVCEPEYLSDSAAIGCRYGICRCGTTVMSIHKFCHECGVKLEWEGVHG